MMETLRRLKELTDSLNQSHDVIILLGELFQKMPQNVFIWEQNKDEHDFILIHANLAAIKTTGLDRLDNIRGKKHSELFPGDIYKNNQILEFYDLCTQCLNSNAPVGVDPVLYSGGDDPNLEGTMWDAAIYPLIYPYVAVVFSQAEIKI